MAERRTYTDEQKAEALEVFDHEGIRAACEAAGGVHHKTIYRWHADRVRAQLKTPGAIEAEQEFVDAMRIHLKRRLIEVAASHLDRSDSEDIGGQDAKHFITAAAIGIDKLLLLSGEATERHGHAVEDGSIARLAEILGVDPEQVPDELARRRASKREAS